MAYDLLLTCERGCAPAVQRELELRKLGKDYQLYPTAVIAGGCSEEDLVKAAYLLQTPTRICWHLGHVAVTLETEETLLALETMIGPLDYSQLFFKDKSSFVDCHREGAHEYNSIDASQETGRMLKRHCHESLGFHPKVEMKKPDILFFLHIDGEEAFLGIDLLGYDNAKRAYKIFNNPHSIKGTSASCLLMASGWKPGEVLLDPFCAGGVIPIEAALMATGQSLHYYDKDLACKRHPLLSSIFENVLAKVDDARKEIDSNLINAFDAQLRNVTAAKKNAKIAGVEKAITFSKVDADWLDTKFAGKSVMHIITQPLEASKHVPLDRALKVNKELFYAADYVLKKNGKATFLCQRPEDLIEAAKEYGLALVSKEQVFTGKLLLWVAMFSKQ